MKRYQWRMTATTAIVIGLFMMAGGQVSAMTAAETEMSHSGYTQETEALWQEESHVDAEESIVASGTGFEKTAVDPAQDLEESRGMPDQDLEADTEEICQDQQGGIEVHQDSEGIIEETCQDKEETEDVFLGQAAQEDIRDSDGFGDKAREIGKDALRISDHKEDENLKVYSVPQEIKSTETEAYENKAVYDYIIRMYDQVLERQPEEAGIRYWYDNIVSGKKTGADVAAAFFGSSEYQAKKVSSELYLEDLYHSLLNRGSDHDGKAYWLGILDTGVSREYLLKGFINANEYEQRCTDSGIEKGVYVLTQARDQNLHLTQYITHFYQTALNRRGDERGLNYWTEGLLTKRMNGAAILHGFMFSNEYVNKEKTDNLYVDDLYAAALSRAADAAGKTYWLAAFDDGLSRHYTAAGFNDSIEYKKMLARYGIKEGIYQWLEARDEKRPVTAYVNQMIIEGTGSRADAETLNTDLRSLYDGKTSAIDLVTKYMSADGFKELNDTDFIHKACQLIYGRNARKEEINDGSASIIYDGRSAMIRQLAASLEFSDFCKKHDILMVGSKDNTAMQYAKDQMDKLNWDVKAAFTWIISNFTYLKMDAYTGSGHTQYYGCYGFEHKKGNCYVMAADFYWMAKAKGFTIDYYEGLVPGYYVPLTPHGWCEATIKGVRYIFDPDFAYETGKNGYMFLYKTPGTWKYTDGVIMNDR